MAFIFTVILSVVLFPVSIHGQIVPLPGGYIPNYAFTKAEAYKREFLRKHSESASNLEYRFFYDEDGVGHLEYTVIPGGNYTWPEPTWIGTSWGNPSGYIGNLEINYIQTRQNFDAVQYQLEERRKDPVFASIEDVIYQVALETDYDYMGAYGVSVKYRSGVKRKATCNGYSSAVIAALRNHPQVRRIVKASSSIGNHEWNLIYLKDGRVLYCDSTWYDGNNIDEEGYVVHVPARDGSQLTFDVNEFNSSGGCIDLSTGKALRVHMAWPDVVFE
jgi:hypothetical protein